VIAVLIPTLGRPHRVAQVAANLAAEPRATAYFIHEADDTATADAIAAAGACGIVNTRSPSYAGAVNTALLATDEALLYVAADDFHWHDGWLDPLLALISAYGVVGSNDLHNADVKAGTMATSFLVRRDYAVRAVVDEPGVMLHEGYRHNYVDTELVCTAMARGEFAHAAASRVEHRHYLWGLAEKDGTYAKTLTHYDADQALFRSRQALWTAA
jgi:hypothetical protein